MFLLVRLRVGFSVPPAESRIKGAKSGLSRKNQDTSKV